MATSSLERLLPAPGPRLELAAAFAEVGHESGDPPSGPGSGAPEERCERSPASSSLLVRSPIVTLERGATGCWRQVR